MSDNVTFHSQPVEKAFNLGDSGITSWDLIGMTSQMFSSCGTLTDGIQHMDRNASEIEDEEKLLLAELQEINVLIPNLSTCFTVVLFS